MPAELETVLLDRSEGDPFLIEELVATAATAGWDTVAAAVPGSVVASVERRLEQLVEAEGQGFRFRHGLTRDAVLAVAPPAEIEVVARRLLDVLVPPGNDAALTGERRLFAAGLATRLGLTDRAARLLVDAADDAIAGGALASAEGFGRQA